MSCEYCGREIKGEPTEKVLRGKKHVFCTECCFNLYFYDFNYPKLDYEVLYSTSRHITSVRVSDEELLGQGD